MIIFGLLSSIAFILGRHTAGTVNFALFIMGAYVLVSIILNRFEKRDFYLFAGWLLVNMLLIMVFGKFGVVSFITSVTTGIAFVALLVAAVDFVIFKLDVLKWRSRVEQKIPLWLASLGFSVVVGALCIIVFFASTMLSFFWLFFIFFFGYIFFIILGVCHVTLLLSL